MSATPGPWRIDVACGERSAFIYPTGEKPHPIIAEVPLGVDVRGERRGGANARLIGRAPETAKAAKDAEMYLSTHIPVGEDPWYDAVLTNLRSALDETEGKE